MTSTIQYLSAASPLCSSRPLLLGCGGRGDFARARQQTYHSVGAMAKALTAWLQPLTPRVSLLYVASDGNPSELHSLELLLKGRWGPMLLLLEPCWDLRTVALVGCTVLPILCCMESTVLYCTVLYCTGIVLHWCSTDLDPVDPPIGTHVVMVMFLFLLLCRWDCSKLRGGLFNGAHAQRSLEMDIALGRTKLFLKQDRPGYHRKVHLRASLRIRRHAQVHFLARHLPHSLGVVPSLVLGQKRGVMGRGQYRTVLYSIPHALFCTVNNVANSYVTKRASDGHVS